MIGFGLLRRIWPYVTIAALMAVIVLLGRRNGRLVEKVDALVRQIELSRRMRDAAATTPRDTDSVAERMRDGDF